MLQLQNKKLGLMLHTGAVATNADSGTYFDTNGIDELLVLVHLGTGSNTTPPSTLQLEQGDTTSAFTAITGYTGGTNSANGFTISNQSTTAATQVSYMFQLTRGIGWNRRYVNFKIRMAGATANATCIAIGGRNEISPLTASEQGVTVLVTPS